MNSRILTISYLYQSTNDRNPVPTIRLQGRWLEELGFCIGYKVTVQGSHNELVIKLSALEKESPE